MSGGQLKALVVVLNIAVSFPGFGGHTTDTADFVLIKTVRGIDLYERWHIITTGELAREVKAVFTVDAELGEVAGLIKNESLALQWNKHTRIYEVEVVAEKDWICYVQYDLPWPVSNQDCVLQYGLQEESNKLNIYFQGTDHALFPLREGVDRIQEVKGKWVVTKSAGKTKIEYYITTTPSKTLPRWITDPIIRNNLIETMRGFRKILADD
jgi:hypothetical protein